MSTSGHRSAAAAPAVACALASALACALVGSLPRFGRSDDAIPPPDAWPKGAEVAELINARDDGESLTMLLVMELIDRRGKRRVRETRMFRRDDEEARRSILFFEAPKNLKGTAFLTYDYPDGRDDDQWLYLPALRKVRRISAADRGGYFLGTDFTYEDMKLGPHVSIDEYTFETVGFEVHDDRRCYVVEAVPVSDDVMREVGYGRIRLWVDAERWFIVRSQFWDAHDQPLKSVVLSDWRQVGGIWTAHHVEARRHQTGHATVFDLREVEYDGGLPEELFSKRSLSRGP